MMIDPKELRIGNLVRRSVSKEERIVSPANLKRLVLIPYTYEPIPITEEWLLKFGFKYRHNLKDWYLPRGQQGEVFIYQNITLYLCEPNKPKKFLCNLEHVHQLQNLYFALTGEELQIKK